VETLEERGTLSAVEAASALFATSSISDGLACSLLAEVTAGDSRLVCAGTTVSLTGGRADPFLDEAEFVVFDLETTGLSAARDQICEVGAVRVRALESVDSFQSLVNPRMALPEPVARLTGLREQELRGAPSTASVLRRFLAFAGDELLVAHNARFDQRFLERQLLLRHGRRLSEPPLCTAALARPERAPAAVGRSGAARARADRVARPRFRARSRARGGTPDPRAPAAGQLAQPQKGARRLPEAPGRGLRRHRDGDRARPDREPPQSIPRGAGTRVEHGRGAGPPPGRRAAAPSACTSLAPGREPALRGGG